MTKHHSKPDRSLVTVTCYLCRGTGVRYQKHVCTRCDGAGVIEPEAPKVKVRHKPAQKRARVIAQNTRTLEPETLEPTPETLEPAPGTWNRYARHGITRAVFDAIVIAQNGGCALCGVTHTYSGLDRDVIVPLVIDHDHKCHPGGYGCRECVRGVLCMGCNTQVGLLERSPFTTYDGEIWDARERWSAKTLAAFDRYLAESRDQVALVLEAATSDHTLATNRRGMRSPGRTR